MRAANGKLLLAENGSGQIAVLTINGDKANVTVIKDGLQTPTAVERPQAMSSGSPRRGAGQSRRVNPHAEITITEFGEQISTTQLPIARSSKSGNP